MDSGEHGRNFEGVYVVINRNPYKATHARATTALSAAMIAFSQLRCTPCRKMDEVMKPSKAHTIDAVFVGIQLRGANP